jgi:hypothetical protein
MTAEEIKNMLLFRWTVAGGTEEDFPFQPDDEPSFEIIAESSNGVPRDALKIAADRMNNLWRDGRKKTTPQEAEKVSIDNRRPLEQLTHTKYVCQASTTSSWKKPSERRSVRLPSILSVRPVSISRNPLPHQ